MTLTFPVTSKQSMPLSIVGFKLCCAIPRYVGDDLAWPMFLSIYPPVKTNAFRYIVRFAGEYSMPNPTIRISANRAVTRCV